MICPLEKFIDGRTVMLAFPGPSVVGLKDIIEELAPYDVVWMGTHKFHYIEHDILRPAGLEFDIIAYGPIRYEEAFVTEFLSRERQNFLLMPEDGMAGTVRNLPSSGPKIVIGDFKMINNMTVILVHLRKICISKVIMFGLDGVVKGNKIHYGQEEIVKNIDEFPWYHQTLNSTPWNIMNSRELVNRDFYSKYWPRSGNDWEMEIVNCCPDSEVLAFRKIGYPEVIGEIPKPVHGKN